MGEKHALNMLFKLDLLTKMHNLIGEMYKNGIKISDDDQSDSLISCFKRILKLISSFMVTEQFYFTTLVFTLLPLHRMRKVTSIFALS